MNKVEVSIPYVTEKGEKGVIIVRAEINKPTDDFKIVRIETPTIKFIYYLGGL